MRIVTSKQMKQIEQNSIQYQMSYLRLMENAGCAAAQFIAQTLHDVNGLNCVVFSGKGNNGGDGFVVARKLSELGANVTIVLTDGEPKTDDAAKMLHIARMMELTVLSFEDDLELVNSALADVDVIIDSVFGSGFHGEMDVRRRQVCSMINSAIAAVFSLDIPSGVNCDTGEAAQDAVQADFTIAFDSYKPAHMLPKYLPNLGQVTLAPIGIDPLFPMWTSNRITLSPTMNLFTPKSRSKRIMLTKPLPENCSISRAALAAPVRLSFPPLLL